MTRLRPPAPRQLERDPASERVAGEVGVVEARAPHLVLDRVGERLGRRVDARRERLRAPESGQVDRKHVESPSSSGSIGLQPLQVWPIPWMRTSGSPDPPL